MSESRVFMLNGTEVQAVVDRLETFLHTKREWRFKAHRRQTDT